MLRKRISTLPPSKISGPFPSFSPENRPKGRSQGGYSIQEARKAIDALPTDPGNHILYAKKRLQELPTFGHCALWWVSWNHGYSHQTYPRPKHAYMAILYHRMAHPEDPIHGYDPEGVLIPQEKLERFAYMVMFPHSSAYADLRSELDWEV